MGVPQHRVPQHAAPGPAHQLGSRSKPVAPGAPARPHATLSLPLPCPPCRLGVPPPVRRVRHAVLAALAGLPGAGGGLPRGPGRAAGARGHAAHGAAGRAGACGLVLHGGVGPTGAQRVWERLVLFWCSRVCPRWCFACMAALACMGSAALLVGTGDEGRGAPGATGMHP